jgi:hypothetical protein
MSYEKSEENTIDIKLEVTWSLRDNKLIQIRGNMIT